MEKCLPLSICVFYIFLFFTSPLLGQGLPKGFAPGEKELLPDYISTVKTNRSGMTSAPGGNLRTMAEWEELQGLFITWTSFPVIQAQIVKAARLETTVYIHCSDSGQVKNYLMSQNIPLTNIKYLQVGFNSIWMRDYGGNTVYRNDVDSMILVDWIYNRPRPLDDAIPEYDAVAMGVPFYQTYASPSDLVNTGGNFMVDGFGTAFASKLILEENEPGNPYNVSVKSETQINQVMSDFMGLERYIKMETLPYDGIHHIDMHMKLLDEETLLIGQYPAGVSDGPQIEANMLYVLDSHLSMFGTPYKIVRIPMPPSTTNQWPSNGGSYRTYTNSVFINNTLIFPSYREEYDTIAIRIYKENLPGYQIVPIDCDNTGSNIIQQSGAIHCITHSGGVAEPMLISHQRLPDTYQSNGFYTADAYINHKSGIQAATLYYTTDTTQAYQALSMTLTNPANHAWTAQIPAQPEGTTIWYYISATSNSGKTQVRPIVAPSGWWRFRVLANPNAGMEFNENVFEETVFPNPASAITCIPIKTNIDLDGELYITDMNGKKIRSVYNGMIPAGQANRYYTDVDGMTSGIYNIVLRTQLGNKVQKLVVR
jgi:agmatine deiminase